MYFFFLVGVHQSIIAFFFFLNDTAPTEISPLPLHDALPISLHLQVLAAALLLDARQCLSERMPRQMRWRVGPQQVHQIVARELLPRLGRESDQERKMLARAEADLLPRLGQQ